MNKNNIESVAAGFFDFSKGHFVFSDVIHDEKFLKSVELHESIHAQLHNTSHLGALVNHLHRFNSFVSNPVQMRCTKYLISLINQSQLFVQESVATYCMTIYLLCTNYLNTNEVESFLTPKYYEYLEPLIPFIESNIDHIDGAINLGFACLNSPIIERLSEISETNEQTLKDFIENPSINPKSRFDKITKLLDDFSFNISDLVPERKLNDFIAILKNNNILIVDNPSEYYLAKQLKYLLDSPLLNIDKDANRKYKTLNIEYQKADFTHFTKSLSVFLRREIKIYIINSEKFNNVIDVLLNKFHGLRTPFILEVRSEDLIFDQKEAKLTRLEKDKILLNFFPLPGSEEDSISSILTKKEANKLIKKAINNSVKIIASSNRYEFSRSRFIGLNLPNFHSVILSVGNCMLLEKLLGEFYSAKETSYFFQNSNKEGLIFLVLCRNIQRHFYTLIPCTSTIINEMNNILVNRYCKDISAEKIVTNKIKFWIDPLIYHLSTIGWAYENEIKYEDIDFVVPTRKQLHHYRTLKDM